MEPPFNKNIKCQVRNAHKSATVGPMVSTTLGYISPFFTSVTPMLNQHWVLIKCNLKRVLIYCIPEKQGYDGSCMVIVHVHLYTHLRPQRSLVFNLQATFLLAFLLNFAGGFLWQRSGNYILLVAQESKLCFDSEESNG